MELLGGEGLLGRNGEEIEQDGNDSHTLFS